MDTNGDWLDAADSELIVRIHQVFEHHPHLKSSRYQFRSDEGTITVCGRARSYFEKQLAQEALRPLAGTRTIANELEVRR